MVLMGDGAGTQWLLGCTAHQIAAGWGRPSNYTSWINLIGKSAGIDTAWDYGDSRSAVCMVPHLPQRCMYGASPTAALYIWCLTYRSAVCMVPRLSRCIYDA